VGEQLVVDVAAGAAQGGHTEAVVLDRPAHDGVGGRREAPHLLGLLLVVAPAQRALAGVGQRTAQGVQVLTLVELPDDPAPIRLVREVAGGVQGAPQRPVLLDRGGQGVLLPLRRAELADDQGGGGMPALHARGDA
jgi:hypothetical protein